MKRVAIRVHHAVPIGLLVLVAIAIWALPGWLDADGSTLPRVILFGAAVAWLVFGIRLRARAWRVLDTPTSKVIAATVGHCELAGTTVAAAAHEVVAPASHLQCVWFKWELQEYRRSGKNRRWVTVDRSEARPPFFLRDDSGDILVDPTHAEFHGFETYVGPNPYGEGRFRQLEWRLPVGVTAYVLGPVRTPTVAGAATLEVACDDGGEEFIISDDGERTIARRFGGWAWFSLVLGLVAVALAPLLTADVSRQPDGDTAVSFASTGATGLAVALVMAYVAVLGLSWLLRVYNRLVIVKNQAVKAWASIEVQLQRRFDLIANLVAVVQAYTVHERTTLAAVAAARARGVLPDDSELATAATHDTAAHADARQLLALAEAYPELDADEQYRQLAAAVTDAENRIAWSRTFYNDAITLMRDRHHTFPYVLVASFATVPSLELFEATEPAALPSAVSGNVQTP